jgi:hypothetical protein
MIVKKTPLLSLLVFAALSIASIDAVAAVSCAPLVAAKVTQVPYLALNQILTPHLATLRTKLAAVRNEATYATLLAEANATAASTANGRVVITLPDGTVVVDTSKGANNTFANFQAKTINENHNSRVAILDAQLFECGIGVETKRSSTTGAIEDGVARRLGVYLNNAGTARMSATH